jgi:hypothetical protein
MTRLALALLVLAGSVVPLGAAYARSPAALEAARAITTVPAAELVRRLKAQHAAVDKALAKRRDRFDAWQQAVLARDEAAADVERLKRGDERGAGLERALRKALVLDQDANLARSQLMASESEVARTGAQLLQLYDAVLALKRREISEMRRDDPRRAKRVRAYQALTAQRDRVRRSLGPVLRAGRDMGGDDDGVAATPEDDIETLLEKADLARDLEERFLRRAQAVQRRIREVMEEREVARDVAGMVRDQSLFDEDDMRLFVVGDQVSRAPGLASALPSGNGSGGGNVAAAVGAPASDSAARSTNLDQEESASGDQAGGLFGGGNADGDAPPPPAADPSPSPPMEPSAGAENDDDGVADFVDNGATGGGGTVALPPDVGGVALPRAAERAFAAGSADVDLDALLSSGELSLPQLRALHKRLQERAKKMRKQEAELKREVENRARR